MVSLNKYKILIVLYYNIDLVIYKYLKVIGLLIRCGVDFSVNFIYYTCTLENEHLYFFKIFDLKQLFVYDLII